MWVLQTINVGFTDSFTVEKQLDLHRAVETGVRGYVVISA